MRKLSGRIFIFVERGSCPAESATLASTTSSAHMCGPNQFIQMLPMEL
jgi:hypothetical protein